MARFFNYYTGQWVDTQAEVRPPGSTPAATSAAAPAKTSNAEPVRVTVKQGQTLEQIAKENNTTVTQILLQLLLA
jgi:LysM repeat protein